MMIVHIQETGFVKMEHKQSLELLDISKMLKTFVNMVLIVVIVALEVP
jgi:hypothetical protein